MREELTLRDLFGKVLEAGNEASLTVKLEGRMVVLNKPGQAVEVYGLRQTATGASFFYPLEIKDLDVISSLIEQSAQHSHVLSADFALRYDVLAAAKHHGPSAVINYYLKSFRLPSMHEVLS